MSVKESKKPVVRQLYNLTKDDVWTNGANLRKILLLPNKLSVDDFYPEQHSVPTDKGEYPW